MLVAVACFGLVPAVIAVGQEHNPFLFASVMRLGIAVFCLLVIAVFFSRSLGMFLRRGSLVFLRRRFLSREMAGILFSYFDFAVLALSLRWAAPSASAVIYEVWPILLICIVARWTGGRYCRLDGRAMFLFPVPFLGVVFVLASQSGGFSGLWVATFRGFPSELYAGLGLALAAAFITAFTGFSWVWSYNSLRHRDIPGLMVEGWSDRHLEMLFLLVALVLSNSVAFVLNGAVGLAFGGASGEWITCRGLLLAAAGGGVGYGAASVMWRYATALTRNLGLHAMSYGTPVFALLFLALVGQVGDVRGSHLAAGASMIIAANLIISFGSEIRWGFGALLLPSWVRRLF